MVSSTRPKAPPSKRSLNRPRPSWKDFPIGFGFGTVRSVRYLFLALTIALVPWGCAETESNDSWLLFGPTGNPSAALDDAGHSDDHNDAQLDAEASDRDGAGTISELGDASADAASPYADLRTCSGNPLDTFTWPCAASAATCDEATRTSQMCALPWGCDEYVLAVVAAADECAQGRQVITAQACGRTVIELRVGPGSPTRAFYTSSGGLMGTWSSTDVLSDPQSCSGFIPKDCLDWEGQSFTDIVNLCAQPDAGSDASASDAAADAQ